MGFPWPRYLCGLVQYNGGYEPLGLGDFGHIKGSPSMRSLGPCLQIFVTILSGVTMTLEVASADPIGAVKLALQVKVFVPRHAANALCGQTAGGWPYARRLRC